MARPRKEQNEPQNDVVVENDDVVLDDSQSDEVVDDETEEQADDVQQTVYAVPEPCPEPAQESQISLDDAHKNGIGTAVPAAE